MKNGMPYLVEKSESMKTYWEGLNHNKLITTQCDRCQSVHFPPSPKLCTSCFGVIMNWVELPLSGTVTTFTLVTAPPEGFTGNYYLASVKIDTLEKAILGRFVGESLEIGDRVKLNFEIVGDQSIIIFIK